MSEQAVSKPAPPVRQTFYFYGDEGRVVRAVRAEVRRNYLWFTVAGWLCYILMWFVPLPAKCVPGSVASLFWAAGFGFSLGWWR